jgi:hypothetical protein
VTACRLLTAVSNPSASGVFARLSASALQQLCEKKDNSCVTKMSQPSAHPPPTLLRWHRAPVHAFCERMRATEAMGGENVNEARFYVGNR